MRRGCGRQLRGYTLIEMMAVVVIVAIVMSLAIVNSDKISPRFEMDKVAGEMAKHLRSARNWAIVSERIVRMEIYPDRHEIEYYYEDPTASPDDALYSGEEPFHTEKWEDRVNLQKAIIGVDETLDRTNVVLRFWPNGLCTPVRLYMTYQEQAHRLTIRLNPLTGETTVTKGFEQPEEYEMKATAPGRP